MSNLSSVKSNAIPIIVKEIVIFFIFSLTGIIISNNTKHVRITAMISICPASKPKLNANNALITDSDLPKSDLSKIEKPMPCMNPKKSARV